MPLLVSMISPRQTALNYLNQEIPVGLGLVFVITIVPAILIAIILSQVPWLQGAIYLVTLLSFGLLGLIDDTLGSREARGFIGHFRALAHGNLTTGALKALLGGVIALLVAWITTDGFFNALINALNIALFANLTNLLDVRPGRAGKFFIFSSLVLFLLGNRSLILLYVFTSVLGYIKWDLNAKVMMGDVGSNVLGAVLGLVMVELAIIYRVIVSILLVVIHLYAEQYSLTQLIENTEILKFFDQIGRGKV